MEACILNKTLLDLKDATRLNFCLIINYSSCFFTKCSSCWKGLHLLSSTEEEDIFQEYQYLAHKMPAFLSQYSIKFNYEVLKNY